MNTHKTFNIFLEKKVSEKHIDKIIDGFYEKYSTDNDSSVTYIFDFSDVEWISNEELLVLTGLFKYLIEAKVKFKVYFLKKGSSAEIDERRAKRFVEIWEVWKIYQILKTSNVDEYFDVNLNVISRLKIRFNITSNTQEIYERYGVTPFICLNKIENYDDRRIGKMLENVYKLSHATNEILLKNNCHIPFQNKTLSSIITKELYENFLDHHNSTIFKTPNQFAFMSLSLKGKFDKKQIEEGTIQALLKNNFQQESLEEVIEFYYDKKNKKYKNQSLLELSFLDFGEGIPSTLKHAYKKSQKQEYKPEHFIKNLDTQILEYAFRYDSSQHPIIAKYLKKSSIPRGLFDLLSIVKRFEGLLVARSNYGKIFFDFSNGKNFTDAIGYFGNEKLFFPGTLISIYLPERNLEKKFDITTIKPYEVLLNYKFPSKHKKKYVSVFELQNKLKEAAKTKEELYNAVFELLIDEFIANEGVVYLDFEGFEIDERVSKKIIYFLISDYLINLKSSVIVINPPPKSFLEQIKKELIDLNFIDKLYKLHPTPFIYLHKEKDELELYWLGLFSEEDIEKLNDLFLDYHDLRKTDFEIPESVVGHINSYDSNGNLVTFINRKEILEIYKREIFSSRIFEIEKIVKKCIKKEDNSIYLCPGNYYQYSYLQLFDVLASPYDCEYLSTALFNKLSEKLGDLSSYKFLSITSSSQKLLNFLIKSKKVSKTQAIVLDNYHSFSTEDNFKDNIKKKDNVILLCDVISTGYMTQLVEINLAEKGAILSNIAVIVDAMDAEFEPEKCNYYEVQKKLLSLYSFAIKKFKRNEIKKLLIDKNLKIIRINPYTNTTITSSIVESNYNTSVLISNKKFIDIINDDHVKVGYYKFNNLVHPYFFDMNSILTDEVISTNLLQEIFSKFKSAELSDLKVIFYPKDSGIKNLDFDILKDKILKNQNIQFFELERFSTSEGWRFPHLAEFIIDIARGKKVMILDDGSCTGESIIQMIDEIAFLEVNEIIVLSIIGRINDHKREFFSRMEFINEKNSTVKIKVLFGCHWHIPTYYIEEGPITKEREWVEAVFQFANTPQSIKDIASAVMSELILKNTNNGNNKYILKPKKTQSIVKELILYKEEIGKITNYRFYKEYFDFINEVVIFYDHKVRSEDRYKKIELLCAVFLHEPYYYERTKFIVPDLAEKIEEFVLTIFFGNPQSSFNVTLDRNDLSYKWQNKNLIHLLFIIFKNRELFSLLDSEKLTILIRNFATKSSDVDYLLYKLTFYLPFSTQRIHEKKHIGDIKKLIDSTIVRNEVEYSALKKLKRYKSFINTLPDDKSSFSSALAAVKDNYNKLIDEKHHPESILVQIDIIQTQLELLSSNYKNETEVAIIMAWEKISPFIDDILKFSNSYPQYFKSFNEEIYNKLEIDRGSLRTMQGVVSDLIYTLKNDSDIKRIDRLIKKIHNDFIISQSNYYKIFQNTSTINIEDEFGKLINKLKNKYPKIEMEIKRINLLGKILDIPLLLLQNIIFNELLENFRYCDFAEPVYFEWEEENTYLIFNIKNRINHNAEKGGGRGLVRLETLSEMPNKVASFEKNDNDPDYFYQKFKFKTI